METSTVLLQSAVAAPLLAGILVVLAKSAPLAARKTLAFFGFAVPFVLALALCWTFADACDPETGYAFVSDVSWLGIPSLGFWLKFGLNGVSLPLFVMAAIVGFAAGLRALWTKDVRHPTLYYAMLLLIELGVLGLFASVDVFSFYIFHEFALIPTFIAILMWGGYGKRGAAMMMAVYLTVGGMIALGGLLWLYTSLPAVGFNFIDIKQALIDNPGVLAEQSQNIIAGILILGFGILVSLFPFHSWAPDTYTSAPTPVSMFHAGVLKKFGLYGLVQIGIVCLPLGMAHWANWLVALAICNIVVIGLITLAQKNLKHMVSYSSVNHMGPIFLGIAAYSLSSGDMTGVAAAVIMMFAHGLSVALLFHLTESVAQRTGTLEMAKIGGLAKQAPVLAAFFVAAAMASVGLPGFANFWGELSIFVSLVSLKPFWLISLVLITIVISAIYSLRAVARVFFGPAVEGGVPAAVRNQITDITLRERVPAFILFAALLAVGFVPSLITDPVNAALCAPKFVAEIEIVPEENPVPADAEPVLAPDPETRVIKVQ
ncbi:MAG: NADH-quinone oxidoreductase subunit M [Opitutales bacterium]|nr:NADH-quinone oxidoreductase subunit M [Opitutales bacterium]